MSSRNTRQSTKRKSEASVSQATSTNANRQAKRSKTSGRKTGVTSKSQSTGDDASKHDELLSVQELSGDIFAAPQNTVIIHACNCQGSWGAGIAKAFHDRYPKAYREYAQYCKERGDELLDSAQLIPPVDSQAGGRNSDAPKHFVGCLFTSRHYGKKKDSPSRILAATKPAMEDLLRQIKDWNAEVSADEKVGEARICKINSGLFAVPWEKTKAVLESIDVADGDIKAVKVISPPT